MKHSKKRIASIIVLSVIIAAGALFTAVYDVLYKYNTTNTTILNAATVDKRGQTYWTVIGTAKNSNETITFNFDNGTWMIIFGGQDANPDTNGWNRGYAADCLAFYKSSDSVTNADSMTVQLGVGGGTGSYGNGGGKTLVTTNFALPMGYSGELTAIAAGAGAIYNLPNSTATYWTEERVFMVADGTFKGWTGDSNAEVKAKMGLSSSSMGCPASWYADGLGGYGIRSSNTSGENGVGGGAGYFNGGSDHGGQNVAGGGSCTPWCYPMCCSDNQVKKLRYRAGDHAGEVVRSAYSAYGMVYGFRMDPTNNPEGKHVQHGITADLVVGGTGVYTPNSALRVIGNYSDESDLGIRVG